MEAGRHSAYERAAEDADFPHFGIIGRFQEDIRSVARQVFATTMLVVESIHAADFSSFRYSCRRKSG
jgi:hypothetical protein